MRITSETSCPEKMGNYFKRLAEFAEDSERL
jgi:hypothetical protein